MNLVDLVRHSLEEDLGNGDVTTESIIPAGMEATACVIAKQDLVFFGHELAECVFNQLGASYERIVYDGASVKSGATIANVFGPARAILGGERIALNLLMRMSGICTHTRSVVTGLTGIKIVDTRKTTPLWRRWERAAVKAGGGFNHRYALFDGVLIKDNHIAIAGSIKEAVQKARLNAHHLLKIEIEVESIQQLEEAINAGADVVMLDNMDNNQIKEAVRIAGSRVLLEASGNMTAERIRSLQGSGVHVISMGGLIHQATWADLSMKIKVE